MLSRRQRKGGPRSRRGCLTCRQRHVKCDEVRPSCLRCRKSDMTCEYGSQIRMLIKPIGNIPAGFIQHPAELRSFEYFYRRTSLAIQGHFDSDFWSSLVLQLSQSEPCVRHAITALGAFHEQFGSRDAYLPRDAQTLIEGDFAIKQYQLAIRHLGTRMSSKSDDVVQLSLICAILFVCFDNFNGNKERVTTHLRGAMSIIQERQGTKCNTQTGLFTTLADIITRFDVQSSTFIDVRDLNVQVAPLEAFPESFKDLREATRLLVRDLNWILHLDRSNDYYLSFKAADSLEEEARATAFASSSILASRLRQWSTKFDVFLAPLLLTMSSKDLRASTMLKIYHAIGTILVSVCHNSDETAFDLCMHEFDKILKLCGSLIAAQLKDEVEYTPLPCEMGLICPLVITSRKCRHPVTRRRALAIIKQAPPQEGPWDRDVAYRVSEKIIEIEEAGLEIIENAGDIPSSQRVQGDMHTVERGQRRINLSCVMRPWGDNGDEGYFIRSDVLE